MKVLHIVAGELTGGAARGAYWLHKGLKQHGVDSKIFTNSRKTFNDPDVTTISTTNYTKAKSIIRSQLDKIITRLYLKRKNYIFSTGLFGVNFTKTKIYKNADVIHLHWINAGLVNIKHLSKIHKPIVWTMRDMWPMTGGCHYSFDCLRFKIGCGKCVQLSSNKNLDLSKLVLKRKENYYPKNMTFVGISGWLSSIAKESKLIHNYNIVTIPNNITADFFPIDKKTAKKVLNIKTHKKIILVGATAIDNYYKGFDKFLESLTYLNKDNYFVCLFGNVKADSLKKIDFEYVNLGYINDNISLRIVYSVADVFVAPSIMDAFGKTIAESMACGTPVVCFDATGPAEIVDHEINGYKATPFSSESLAQGIDWIIDRVDYKKISINAVSKATNFYSNDIVAQQYIELYKEVISNL